MKEDSNPEITAHVRSMTRPAGLIPNQLFALNVTAEAAPLVLELFSRAAVSGDKAHILADLYAQAVSIQKRAGGAA